MTIIAKRSVQLKGHIYSKGEAAEWNGPVDSRIAANFMTKDGKELFVTAEEIGSAKGARGEPGMPANKGQGAEAGQPEKKSEQGGDNEKSLERIEKLVKQLGEKGIKQKLDDLGVPYPPKMAVKQLALLLLQQQGEV